MIANSRRLYVAQSLEGYGRGVFTQDGISEGDLFERSPVLIVPTTEVPFVDSTVLYNYYFRWGTSAAIALGFGSLFNHSYRPSAKYATNETDGTVDFVALRDIAPGEEVFVNYNRDPESQEPLWFEVA